MRVPLSRGLLQNSEQPAQPAYLTKLFISLLLFFIMAKVGPTQSIKIPSDVYEEIYTLKGPRKSFGGFIRDLLYTVYPPEKEDESQTTLAPVCPECGEILDDGECPGCGYPEE